MEPMDIESVEHAPLEVLRDLWEVRYGYEKRGLHQNSKFWWAVANRLADTGWLHSQKTVTHTVVFFRLREPVV